MKTTVVNIRKQPHDRYIGRHDDPEKGKYGNPFTHIADKKTKAQVIVKDRKTSIEYCRRWLLEGGPFLNEIGIVTGSELYVELMRRREIILSSIEELRGKTLGCFCKPQDCHGDIYVEMLEK